MVRDTEYSGPEKYVVGSGCYEGYKGSSVHG